jgi:hypothetical protein
MHALMPGRASLHRSPPVDRHAILPQLDFPANVFYRLSRTPRGWAFMFSWIGRRTAIAIASIVLVAVALAAWYALSRPHEYFGRFEGSLEVRQLDGGRRIELLGPYRFTDVGDVEWIAPKGTIADGASIPQPFWSIIGGPLEGRYRNASVIHDAYCESKSRSWESVHLAFYYAMRASGVTPIKAKVMYFAVAAFGPRWIFMRDAAGKTILQEASSPIGEAELIEVHRIEQRLTAGEDIPIEALTPLAIGIGNARFPGGLQNPVQIAKVVEPPPAPAKPELAKSETAKPVPPPTKRKKKRKKKNRR